MSTIFKKNILTKKPANIKVEDEKKLVRLKKTHYFINGIILIACSSISLFVTHHYVSIYIGIILMVFVNVKFQKEYREINEINFQ